MDGWVGGGGGTSDTGIIPVLNGVYALRGSAARLQCRSVGRCESSKKTVGCAALGNHGHLLGTISV